MSTSLGKAEREEISTIRARIQVQHVKGHGG